jgi:hypothetical protein
LPIIALQIKGKFLEISTLDMPNGAYYRMVKLESVKIPFIPPKDVQSLMGIMGTLVRLRVSSNIKIIIITLCR